MIGLTLDEVNKRMSFLGIPDSVLQFLFSLFLSLAFHKFLPSDVVKEIIEKYSWTSLQPETLLMVMLPPLLFESSFKINSHLFFSKLYLIIALTVVAYFITLFVSSAIMLPLLIQTEHFKISAVFLFVSIVVATDPVAVVAILEQYGAPHRLRILIEGESLLNDGLALTTYRILVSILTYEMGRSEGIDYNQLVFELFMNVFVSPLMGAYAAKVVAWILSKLQENKKRQAFILVSVYSVFMLCELCSGSPALGLVAFGVMLNFNREMFAPETTAMALELWAAMGYWANNVIFFFAGFSVGGEIFKRDHAWYSNETAYNEIHMEDMLTLIEGILLSPVMLLARIASVFLFYKFCTKLLSQPIPSRAEFTILAYAGLRGALGLILAMEVRLKLKGYITTKILLLTCSTTFACLVFQGMTFSKLATREGSTKRSKYVRDSCFRLCRYLEVKAREAVRELEVGECAFLSGTNWNVVRTQTIECLQKHTSQMENEVMQQQNEGILESDEDQEEKDEKGELIDTRVAFYAILLAHVQDSWVRGELTGKTAHIIVQILEHGIDEGKITADDVEHHLDIIGPNFLDRILFRISEILFTWISYDNWFNEFAEIGDCPLFVVQRTNSIQYVTSRPFEKWWIFQTVISSVICVLLAHANFDDVGEVFRAVIYLLIMLLWLMNVTQTVYIFHKKSKTVQATTSKATSKNDGEKRVGSTFKAIILSKECLPAILACTVLTAAVVLSAIVLNEGYCIRGDNFHTVKCESLRSATFTLVLLFTLYKITRMTPLFVVLLREHTIEKKLMHSRIRLAAVHYLHHVVSAIKISPDLFSSSAYRKARMEAISFDKVIDALLRLDLKENPSNIDVMPVIKTRQAIRMMSYHLQQILNSLSIEGFVPPDSKEKWQEVVNELRDSADAILWVPQIASEDWLMLVKWIRLLRESTKQKVIDILTSAMSYSKVRKLQAGTTLFTEGKKMWFLNKGVCKITEWLPLRSKRRYHVFHVGQGAFLGIRNVLLQNWKGGSLPLMWPRRRYETTTYCEVVEINKDAIVELITAEPSIYKIISNEVQGNRLITELRHMCKKKHQTNANTFWTSFQRYGKSLTKAEQLNVPEGRIGVVGCWTQITLVAPQAALNSHLHIKGPAKLWVEPADPRAPGMVYFEKIRYEEPDDAVADDKSCISLKRYGPKKKLVPSPE